MNRLERNRMFYLLQRIGCLACRRRGYPGEPCQAHHPNLDGKAGQKRLGDDIVIALCPWHHVAEPRGGLSADLMRIKFGPSLKSESRAFRAEFGTDEELIAEQKRLIEQYEGRA